MPESLISTTHERLLAALFVRSNISNRRRRHAAGYLMSELDGVTLSQSEIFVAYRELVAKGYIVATTAYGDLVMKLTQDGDVYCRQVIFPELLSGEHSGSDDENLAATPELISDSFPELSGLAVSEIVDRLRLDPELASRIANAADPEGALPDALREEVRRATVQVSSDLADLNLANFEAAQADASTRIVMILADAPSADKKDIAHFLGIVADLIGVGTAAWLGIQALKAYLLAH